MPNSCCVNVNGLRTTFIRTCYDLWLSGLTDDTGYSVGVSCESVHVRFGSHVPDSSGGISARRQQYVYCGMQRQGVNSGQMAMIVSYHFIVF